MAFIAGAGVVLILVPTMAWRSQHQAGFAALAVVCAVMSAAAIAWVVAVTFA